MFRGQSQAEADSFELVGTGRILTTGHGGSEVVRNHHGDVGIVVDGIEQAGHA